jgi:hypothetical protein
MKKHKALKLKLKKVTITNLSHEEMNEQRGGTKSDLPSLCPTCVGITGCTVPSRCPCSGTTDLASVCPELCDTVASTYCC